MAGKDYVYRLMKAKCIFGSMENYLNIKTDHGILAGPDQEPLLNANDHTKDNVIHFGTCKITKAKCEPVTPMPWINGNESNVIDGAPALMTSSKLACLCGGVISIVSEGNKGGASNNETESTNEPPKEDVVADAVSDAFSDAKAKIATAGEAGAEAVEKATKETI